MRNVAKNRRAFADYEILDRLETGLVLTGQEVKSAKGGGASLTGSYAKVLNGELFLIGAQIRPYAYAAGLENYDPQRSRKLLVHASERRRLKTQLEEKGRTLIPLELYVKKGKLKLLLGVGAAKKKHDKRETIKRRETKREIARAIKTQRI